MNKLFFAHEVVDTWCSSCLTKAAFLTSTGMFSHFSNWKFPRWKSSIMFCGYQCRGKLDLRRPLPSGNEDVNLFTSRVRFSSWKGGWKLCLKLERTLAGRKIGRMNGHVTRCRTLFSCSFHLRIKIFMIFIRWNVEWCFELCRLWMISHFPDWKPKKTSKQSLYASKQSPTGASAPVPPARSVCYFC